MGNTPRLTIKLLGGWQLLWDGAPLALPTRQHTRSLWAYILLNQDAVLPRDRVAFALWPDDNEDAARANLRRHLYRLGKHLAEHTGRDGWLESDRRTVRWPADAAALDVARLEAGIAAVTDRTDDPPALDILQQAADSYRGDLLPDGDEEWLIVRRRALRDGYARLLAVLADRLAGVGDLAAAVARAEQLVAHDPLRETSHRQLMTLHARAGDRAAALRQFERCRVQLRDELGVDPEPTTLALHSDILRGAVGSAPDTATAGAPAPDSRAALRPTPPPAPLTPLVGRDDVLAQLTEQPLDTRLLTLTGAGGAGKTRLAVALARRLERTDRRPEAVCWVELGALRDAARVPAAVAEALGLRGDEDGVPAEQRMIDGLRGARLRLVLDNCEHVVAACATLVSQLLAAAPGLRVIATSREPLGIPGEAVWSVQPLETPEPESVECLDDLQGFAAPELFMQRARAARPDLTPDDRDAPSIAEICARLDGLPLAVELAAARASVLSLAQIAARLDDRLTLLGGGRRSRLPQHKTLRATLDWSHQLLAPAAQTLLRRLAVFQGSWSLEAAEAICADDAPADDPIDGVVRREQVLDLLAGLTARSLVVARTDGEAARYHLLATVRGYAEEQLREHGERSRLRDRHLGWHLACAEAAAECARPERRARYSRLAAEELHAALDHAVQSDTAAALRLATALVPFWEHRGQLTEGRAQLERVLVLPADDVPPDVKAAARRAAANLAFGQADFTAVRALIDDGLALAREAEDRTTEADLLYLLACTDTRQGHYAAATLRHEEHLAIDRALGRQHRIASTLAGLSAMAHHKGRLEQARALLEESLTLRLTLADRGGMACCHLGLGAITLEQRDLVSARRHLGRALEIATEAGEKQGLAVVLSVLGKLELADGRLSEARVHLERSCALRRELGDLQGVGTSLASLTALALREGDLEAARRLAAESLRARRTIGDRRGVVDTLERCSELAYADGARTHAAQLLGAADHLRQALDLKRTPRERRQHERHAAGLRRSLGAERLSACRREGQALPWAEAVALALEGLQPPSAPDRQRGAA